MKSTGNNFSIKKYSLLFVLIITLNNAFGKIKNGYEKEIVQANESLKNLKVILGHDNNLTGSQRRKIALKVTVAENTISYYQLTENLLSQFKMVAPDLFNEIDTIRDAKGRAVNVYIKFVPNESTEVKAWGITYIDQLETDKDAYRSEYGERTVSVKIWIVSTALLVLSHELGHVKYQVPHLASYVDYHKKHYVSFVDQYDYLGHSPNDPSGNSASQFEKRFKKRYSNFLELTNEKIKNPLALLDRIRKNLNNDI